MANRIGTFFILLGVGLIVLFVLSDLAKAPSCNFLIVGAISLVLGVVLWMRDPIKPGPPSGRFQGVKKLMAKKPDQKSASKKK
jgi:hypothetical protein